MGEKCFLAIYINNKSLLSAYLSLYCFFDSEHRWFGYDGKYTIYALSHFPKCTDPGPYSLKSSPHPHYHIYRHRRLSSLPHFLTREVLHMFVYSNQILNTFFLINRYLIHLWKIKELLVNRTKYIYFNLSTRLVPDPLLD